MAMKRMWSKGQFTKEVVKAVQSGALDESVANAVDDYLEENPVDITALEGQDVEVKSITATDGIDIAQLVDSSGNSRFIGDSIVVTDADMYDTYGRWSLSGTHMMIVLAGKFPNGKEFTSTGDNIVLATITIPAWVGAKIVPFDTIVVRNETIVVRGNNSFYDLGVLKTCVRKSNNTTLVIECIAKETFTIPAQNSFARFSFDILIDNQ